MTPKHVIINGKKECNICEKVKSISQFSKSNLTKSKIRGECRDCTNKTKRRIYSENKEKARLYSIKKRHNISPKQYYALVKKQEGLCAICHTPLSSLNRKAIHIDHCHATGKVRGVLCNQCNWGLGHFRDSVLYLDAAKQYLTGAK